MKIALVGVATPNIYLAYCLASLKSIQSYNKNFDIFVATSCPVTCNVGDVHVLRITPDQHFAAVNTPYPLISFNILSIYLHPELQAYDFIITVDGDVAGIDRVSPKLFGEQFHISGTRIERKFGNGTFPAIQSGVVCFNRQQCIEYDFYEKIKRFFEEHHAKLPIRGDDSLLGFFVWKSKDLVVHYAPWQLIPNSLNLRNVHKYHMIHLYGSHHPWLPQNKEKHVVLKKYTGEWNRYFRRYEKSFSIL